MKVSFYTLFIFVLASLFSNEVKAQQVGANIILNPSFDVDDAGWSHYFDYFWDPTNVLAAKASVSVEPKDGYTGNAYKVGITDAGTADYSVQIAYPVALEAGKKYAITFKASADAARTTEIAFQQDVSPKTNWYGSDPINLTTTPSTYGPYYFTATTTDPSDLFKFYLGGGGTANGISAYFDDVTVAEVIDVVGATVPDAPTIGIATAGSGRAFVAFTPPVNDGGVNIKSYTVTSSPGGITATAAASPITVNGLTDGQAYTFTVTVTNGLGTGAASAPSNAVVPVFQGVAYYVSSESGNDNNDGLTTSTAFQTLQFAANVTLPGDTVYAMNGTYTNPNSTSDILDIYNSGNASHWIVYKNYPGQNPQIKLYANNWVGIKVQGADYIIVDGFTVTGNNDSITLAYALSEQANLNNSATSGNGIGCEPEFGNPSNKTHHLIVRNCTVSKCGGGGIYSNMSDYLTFENNTISECAWYSPYGNSAISLLQSWNSDSSTAIKNFVMNNTCYRNEEYIPFVFAGSITDGNGIIIDGNRNDENDLGAYVGKTYIANNLVYDNGGRGIHCYLSDHVIIANNTCYKNCQSPAVHDGEFTAFATDSISFINNIALPDLNIPPINSNQLTTNLTVDHNLWAANSDLANPLGTNTIITSADFILPTSDPLLANFHLQSNSPAINAGTQNQAPNTDKDGTPRLLSDSVDIGCYEYASVLPLTILNFSGYNANENNILNWTVSAEINSNHFEMERSKNGANFINIGRLESNQTNMAQHSYSYTDINCPLGISYYRFKQVDVNGLFTYSKAIALTRKQNASSIRISPNPAANHIDVQIKNTSATYVEIYSAVGQKMQTANINSSTGKFSIDISKLAIGTYFLKIYSNKEMIGESNFIKIGK